MKSKILVLSALTGIIALYSIQSFSEDVEKKRNCLAMSHINRIEVVDNQTLLFHMKGGTDYINHLPYKCHGLKNKAFIHETSLQKYCDLDTITTYDTTIGMRMGSCPLGDFEPYVEELND